MSQEDGKEGGIDKLYSGPNLTILFISRGILLGQI